MNNCFLLHFCDYDHCSLNLLSQYMYNEHIIFSPWARQDTGTIWGGKLSLSFLNRPISVVHFDI